MSAPSRARVGDECRQKGQGKGIGQVRLG